MTKNPGFYAAVWRWHFYAGLLTLPFLVLLAVTGSLYLFKDEITALVYRDLVAVEVAATADAALPPSRIAAAAAGADGTVLGYLPPLAADRSARVYVALPTGEQRDVFVNPYTGVVLGDLPKGDYGNLPLMGFVRNLHSLTLLGVPGNRLIEVVAGWALVLAVTGIYLWWPRGRSGGVVSVRRKAGARVFWRDLHAVTGAFAALLIVFLAATGLPWSGFWGEQVKSAVNAAGLGYPAGYWYPVAQSAVPGEEGVQPPAVADESAHHHAAPSTLRLEEVVTPTPWVLTSAPVPLSGAGTQAIGIDRAVAIVEGLGIAAGYTLMLPKGPTGVYTASVVPDSIAGARTMHLDQYGGGVLFDAHYADLGIAARAIELGTSIHVGQEFGRANQLVMLLACIAIVLLSVSAVAMWWKRRPKGALGAPRYPKDYRLPRAVGVTAVVVGLAFPLTGLSLLVMLGVDLVLPERLR